MKLLSQKTYSMVGTAYILFIPFYYLAIYFLRIDIAVLYFTVPAVIFGTYVIFNTIYVITLFTKNKKYTYRAFKPIMFQILLMIILSLIALGIIMVVEFL